MKSAYSWRFWIGRRTVLRYHYRFDWRASRRRNCLTDTTRTPWYRIAASRISSSSGSRQAFSSPEVSTNVARAAISLTNLSASRCGYLNLSKSLGRLRTSASSVSCHGAEFIAAPCGDNLSGRTGRFEESGDSDISIKQGDERHGGLPLPRPWLW